MKRLHSDINISKIAYRRFRKEKSKVETNTETLFPLVFLNSVKYRLQKEILTFSLAVEKKSKK